MIELRADDVVVTIDAWRGGRIRQIAVGDLDLLVDAGTGPYDWGLYPMVPFVGRIRDGRFSFDGEVHLLPLTMPPHAIHGTLVDVAWTVAELTASTAVLEVELREPWPFAGKVRHVVSVAHPSQLDLRLDVEAHEPMPVTVGWHPWFRRQLARGEPADLQFDAGAMMVRDAAGIPTGVSVPGPFPPRPWDDCFSNGYETNVVWPDALELEIDSTCTHLVVYTEPAHALCVEPQTGPPDAANLGMATVLGAGERLTAHMMLRWWPA